MDQIKKVVIVAIHPELMIMGEIIEDTSIIYKPKVVQFKLIDPINEIYEIILKKLLLDPPSIRTDRVMYAIDVIELPKGQSLIENYQKAFSIGFNPPPSGYVKLW